MTEDNCGFPESIALTSTYEKNKIEQNNFKLKKYRYLKCSSNNFILEKFFFSVHKGATSIEKNLQDVKEKCY